MRTRRSAALVGALLVAILAACSSGHSSTNGTGAASGTDAKSAKTGTVKVAPVHDGELRPVLDEWMRRNHAPGVVVGVQIGDGTPVFVVAGESETSAFRVSSSVTKHGSGISGNIVHIVVVKTNPGYASNPGHAGTGTEVTVFC